MSTSYEFLLRDGVRVENTEAVTTYRAHVALLLREDAPRVDPRQHLLTLLNEGTHSATYEQGAIFSSSVFHAPRQYGTVATILSMPRTGEAFIGQRKQRWDDRWEEAKARGLCYNRPETVRLFFAGRGESQLIAGAKRICNGDRDNAPCPVREICRLTHMNEPFGVWGGLSDKERSNLRRKLRRKG